MISIAVALKSKLLYRDIKANLTILVGDADTFAATEATEAPAEAEAETVEEATEEAAE